MRARLRVTPELAGSPNFRLPPGFTRGEEVYLPVSEVIRMDVDGPFAPGMPEIVEKSWPNGSYASGPPEVGALVSGYGDRLEWQWTYEGANLGCPISMPLLPSEVRAA